MPLFEVFHVGPSDPHEFENICHQGLKSLKEQARSGTINLAHIVKRRCIYWLDNKSQELRIGALYFRPQRPPNTCNYVAIEISGESIVLNNKLENAGYDIYLGSRTTLREFLGGNFSQSGGDYSAEIVIPNASVIRNFTYTNKRLSTLI